MIKLNSSFPKDWNHSPEHGSTIRIESYRKDKVIFVIYDYNNVVIGKAMIDLEKAEELKNFLQEQIKKSPVHTRTGLFDD